MENMVSLTPDAAFWRGKRVFLTGHTGFKGGWLTLWLESLGAEICGYSLAPDTAPNIYSIFDIAKRCEHHEADIRDVARLSNTLRAFAPELVIHMAAQPLVRRSYREPLATISTNVDGTANLLEACRDVESVRAILVVTSDKCYKETTTPHREDDALGGHDIYSASKACAEIITHAYRQSFNLPVVTVRAGNVIGGGDWSEDRLIPDAARAFAAGETLAVRSPAAVRPWQHVVEPLLGYLMLARAMLQNTPVSPSYNFGPAASASVRQVVEQFIAHWPGAWRSEPQPLHEAPLLMLDSALAQKELGWRPQLSVEEAVSATAGWYRAYYGGESPAILHRDMLQLCEKAVRTV